MSNSFANDDCPIHEQRPVSSSDTNPSGPSVVDLTGDNDTPASAQVDDYGYESDSDLDDCDEPVLEEPKGHFTSSSLISPSEHGAVTQPENSDE